MAKKASQRQIVAKIAPTNTTDQLPNFNNFYFAQVSGGEVTAAVEKIYIGGQAKPEIVCAPFEVGDITLTAHYEFNDNGVIGTHEERLQKLRDKVGRAQYDITIETMDCDINKVINGSSRQYASAFLVGLTEPDGDSSSGAPATFSLTFSVSDVKAVQTSPATAGAAA